MKKNYSRRKFIQATIGAGALIAATDYAFGQKAVNQYNPKGLPTAPLGKTGVLIPRIAIGLGSRFLTIKSTDEALAMCTYALDNGLYYWDTAHSYVNNETGAVSEERLGRIVKTRRKEIFLSTKIDSRDPEEAKRKIELSLKRLQTDHLDMMMIHAVESPEDVAAITKSGGVLDLFEKMKEQGVTRFIGFSGHANALALKSMVETRRFDNILFAMNHYGDNKDNRQGLIVPVARQLGMGIMLMKSVRPKETIKDLNPAELVRYALSLDGPSGVAVGMDSKKVVDSNLAILRNFKPMNAEEKKKYAMLLTPYYRHENLPWMQKDYRDGYYA